jgi:hypothetical protein
VNKLPARGVKYQWMKAQLSIMYKNSLTKSPMIKQELLAAGFIEKQLLCWIGSKADSMNTTNTIDKKAMERKAMERKAMERKAMERKAMERMKPAGTPSTGGKIPPSQAHCDALHSDALHSNVIQ